MNNYIDKILKLRKFNVNTLALGFLNLSNHHSFEKYNYKFFLKKNKLNSKYKFNIKYFFLNIFKFLKKNIYKKKKIFYEPKQKVDYIFFSFIISKNTISLSDDFYYGNLHKQVTKKKKNFLYIYLNTTNLLNEKFINKKVKLKNGIILEKNLDILTEFKNFIKIYLIENFKLFKIGFNQKDKKFKKFIQFIRNQSSFSEALNNLRIVQQIENIVKQTEPKFFFIIYEGKLLENIICKNLKKLTKPPIICGYQHSVITNNSFGIKRKLGKPFLPDKIYTTGNINKLKLQKIKRKSEIIGSKKFVKKKINHNELYNFKKKIINCLILPEGIYGEYQKFVNLLLLLNKLNPDINFIWRDHPSYQIKKTNLYKFIKDKKKIIISDRNITEDAKRSSFSIYRGSSSVIETLAYGVIPIYFINDNEGFNLDMIDGYFKNNKLSKFQISNLLKKYKKKSKNELFNLIRKSQKFHDKYYQNLELKIDEV